ncbi:MAG: hypothetical protein OIF32_08940 [Campylobacterales bacterium]|nr:hypothetical protein [Campylobacterales bacterium]
MENKSIANELDDILNDLNMINQLVSEKEKDLASVKDIYITQDGTESYQLTIDKNIFPINKSELKLLANALAEMGIYSEPH